MQRCDIDKSLVLLLVLTPLVILAIIFQRPEGEVNHYVRFYDSWSYVHFLSGFLIAATLMIFKVGRRKILPITTVIALGFEVWENFYMVELAQATGVEGFNNVFFDVALAWGGALLVFYIRDLFNGCEVE